MTDVFRVSPSTLGNDADTWTGWSSDLAAMGTSIPLLGEQLDPLAFSILPNAQQVAAAYGRATRALKASIDTGIAQFTGFAATLTFAATSYREAEEQNVAAIARSMSNLEAL